MSEKTQVKTGLVRFAYPAVFEKKSINGSEPKYSIMVLIDKNDTKTVENIRAAISAAVEESADKLKGVKDYALHTPVKDGDDEHPGEDVYKGKYYLSATTDYAPDVVDKNGNPFDDKGDFYSGCYGKIFLKFYAYNNKANKGVGVGFAAICKLKDGDRIGTDYSAKVIFADDINCDND